MTNTTARIKKSGLHFEISVDMEEALKYKKGESNDVGSFLEMDTIFSDVKKGMRASDDDMEIAFGTTDVNEIAGRIVKEGEVLVTQEFRNEERERKIKQAVDFLSKNAVDPQSGGPISSERIKNALEQAHANIKNTSIENQIKDIMEAISKIIPIKIETKKVKITIPATYTGRIYGIINQYKEKENWLSDGSLEVVVSVPAGAIMDFYDKLNSITHGSAVTEEIKE